MNFFSQRARPSHSSPERVLSHALYPLSGSEENRSQWAAKLGEMVPIEYFVSKSPCFFNNLRLQLMWPPVCFQRGHE
jgi:hypothetical protein